MAYDTFYGADSNLWGSNFYKIYVSEGAMHFARVSDRMWVITEQPVETSAGNSGPIRRQRELETKYDAMDHTTPEFLESNKKNIIVTAADVESAKLIPPTAMFDAMGRWGFLEIKFTTGKKRRFTLAGDAGPDAAAEMIRSVLPDVQGKFEK